MTVPKWTKKRLLPPRGAVSDAAPATIDGGGHFHISSAFRFYWSPYLEILPLSVWNYRYLRMFVPVWENNGFPSLGCVLSHVQRNDIIFDLSCCQKAGQIKGWGLPPEAASVLWKQRQE